MVYPDCRYCKQFNQYLNWILSPRGQKEDFLPRFAILNELNTPSVKILIVNQELEIGMISSNFCNMEKILYSAYLNDYGAKCD